MRNWCRHALRLRRSRLTTGNRYLIGVVGSPSGLEQAVDEVFVRREVIDAATLPWWRPASWWMEESTGMNL
jgi:hypothetical protein